MKRIVGIISIWFLVLGNVGVHADDVGVVDGSSVDSFISVAECIVIGELNYIPLKLAKEQFLISKYKVKRAKRSLFPKVSIIGEATSGEEEARLGTPGFVEQSFGVQTSQPIYEGHRLINTRRHAQINQEVARLKIESIKNDILYSVKEAYYNVIKGLVSVKAYKALLDDIDAYIDMAEKLYAKNLMNKKDFLAAESMKNQVEYEFQVSEIEYQKYLWKLAKAMGLMSPPKRMPLISILSNLTVIVDEDYEFEDVEANNYDIRIKKLEVEAADYQYKIKKAKESPTLKFEGFYGRSASAYVNENFTFKEDYQFDVKFEYSFWGHKMNFTKGTQHTSPKLGQSSRTEAETMSGSFDILDDMEAGIKNKEAKYEYNKAVYEYEKTFFDVSNELKEACLNLKKARMQMKSNAMELQLARTDFSISEINFHDSKIPLNELMAKKLKVVKSEISFSESQIFYLISKASLNKVLGAIYQGSLKVGATDKYRKKEKKRIAKDGKKKEERRKKEEKADLKVEKEDKKLGGKKEKAKRKRIRKHIKKEAKLAKKEDKKKAKEKKRIENIQRKKFEDQVKENKRITEEYLDKEERKKKKEEREEEVKKLEAARIEAEEKKKEELRKKEEKQAEEVKKREAARIEAEKKKKEELRKKEEKQAEEVKKREAARIEAEKKKKEELRKKEEKKAEERKKREVAKKKKEELEKEKELKKKEEKAKKKKKEKKEKS